MMWGTKEFHGRRIGYTYIGFVRAIFMKTLGVKE